MRLKQKKRQALLLLTMFFVATGITAAAAESIYHETVYPEGAGPFPAVIVLHSSGGFKTAKWRIGKYIDAGYAAYVPDFFRRYGISYKNRIETWTTYRTQIEAELVEIVDTIKADPKVDARNIFAVGFSNGGYWASYLAARKHVKAAASHYGVWRFPNHNGFPANYFDRDSNPVLALHGDHDSVQDIRFVMPQLEIVAGKSPRFRKRIFRGAGHSWDCRTCGGGSYDDNAARQALELTLALFAENTH
jgi:dienelactone hydrolase